LKSDNQYIIRFKGLSEGIHSISFNVDSKFFAEFAEIEARDGNLQVLVTLNKKPDFMVLDINIKGTLLVQCDRCLEYFDYNVDYKDSLLVKFSDNTTTQSDEVIILHPNDSELDLKQYIYEYISLSIPYRKVHPETKDGISLCKKEMIDKIHQFEAENNEKKVMANWEKLKNIFETNN
jgi:uncharacterized protein